MRREKEIVFLHFIRTDGKSLALSALTTESALTSFGQTRILSMTWKKKAGLLTGAGRLALFSLIMPLPA